MATWVRYTSLYLCLCMKMFRFIFKCHIKQATDKFQPNVDHTDVPLLTESYSAQGALLHISRQAVKAHGTRTFPLVLVLPYRAH